ncbi:MAG TPA: hypothetical protein VF001_09965, partial [Candidatus Limnocylindria bacterium]
QRERLPVLRVANTRCRDQLRSCGRAVTPMSDRRPESQGSSASTLIRAAALALILVLLGIALLYVYRAQSPARTSTVAPGQRIAMVSSSSSR